MEPKFSRNEILMYVKGIEHAKADDPSREVDIYYLICAYNLLDIGEIDLAEAVFDRLQENYFSTQFKDDLAYAIKKTQDLVEIQNSIESVEDPRQRAAIMVQYNHIRQEAEILLAMADFYEKASRSQYISSSPEFDTFKDVFNNIELDIDINKGLPKLN